MRVLFQNGMVTETDSISKTTHENTLFMLSFQVPSWYFASKEHTLCT